METQPPPVAALTQIDMIQRKLILEGKIKAGVNWFFWIAGLSLINTVIFLFGSTLTFVVGLGVTQFVDGFVSAVAEDIDQGGMIVRLIGLGINVLIAGIFALFGILGRKRYLWTIILGMVLYAADGVILLFFKDFLGAGFHAWALFGIWGGLKAIRELEKLQKSVTASTTGLISR